MIHQFDHRWATYEARGGDSRYVERQEKTNTSFSPLPRYWVGEVEVDARLKLKWSRSWLLGWRDITNATNERTVIIAFFPRNAANHKLPLVVGDCSTSELACLAANLNSLALDYVARQKIGTTSLTFSVLRQFALPRLDDIRLSSQFIISRVLELTYTAEDIRPFAEDLGYSGPPFRWDPERRALLRAELDAYYAYLYGLTRRELEYVLDPKAVMGEDYPSETFRVLKDNEIREFGEFRTQRLVLEAWDRFVADGTFDAARLRDPQYIDRVSDELAATRARLEETERNQRALALLATDTPKPTLFVEGATDKAIFEAAWSVFFPREPLPVKVVPAGGTTQMGSLAGKGKALREVLGDRTILALADNDAAGRRLIEDGHIKKGGLFKQLPNGIHWCLLKPTDGFVAEMKAYKIPAGCWPFTIEAVFAPMLRRAAAGAGAWSFSGEPQAEFFEDPEVGRRVAVLVPKLSPTDDAYWYLMAPSASAKETFAEWVTRPEQRTEANYAALEEIIRGLRDVLIAQASGDTQGRPRAA
jgi:hypothetical protein